MENIIEELKIELENKFFALLIIFISSFFSVYIIAASVFVTQLIALRYGAVPIVRETGGLRDTVEPYNIYTDRGTGFSFANYNADEMLQVINYSKHIFYDRKRQWNQMIDRGITKDFSWNSSKFRYEGLYNYLLGEYN